MPTRRGTVSSKNPCDSRATEQHRTFGSPLRDLSGLLFGLPLVLREHPRLTGVEHPGAKVHQPPRLHPLFTLVFTFIFALVFTFISYNVCKDEGKDEDRDEERGDGEKAADGNGSPELWPPPMRHKLTSPPHRRSRAQKQPEPGGLSQSKEGARGGVAASPEFEPLGSGNRFSDVPCRSSVLQHMIIVVQTPYLFAVSKVLPASTQPSIPWWYSFKFFYSH